MKIMGIVGWKNAGKTHLVVNLVDYFVREGFEVSTLKHAHHDFDIDHPGKDSYQHRKSGAHEVLVASDNRWALMHEVRKDEIPPMTELLSKLEPVDLVLVEGFKMCCHPKIEVYREGQDADLIARTDSNICAVATDCATLDAPCPVLPLNDVKEVASFIQSFLGLQKKTVVV